MDRLVRDGVGLAYVAEGEGDPAIVFVPGGSCDLWSFGLQQEHFRAGHRCVSVDLRGHGDSDHPEQGYTIPGFADDVAWMIGELGLDRPIVVGHSMGGAIALQLVADHPTAARALVLVDPAPVTDNRAGFEQIRASFARHGIDSTRRRMFRNFFPDVFVGEPDEALIDDVLRHGARTPDHVFAAEIDAMRDWDGAGVARRCRLPVLHVAATFPTCPHAALAEAIPHAVLGQAVGTGHFVQLEVPDQVNAMIAGFLRRYVA